MLLWWWMLAAAVIVFVGAVAMLVIAYGAAVTGLPIFGEREGVPRGWCSCSVWRSRSSC